MKGIPYIIRGFLPPPSTTGIQCVLTCSRSLPSLEELSKIRERSIGYYPSNPKDPQVWV